MLARLLPVLFLVACLWALDPYDVLGVARDADDKAIKSAYRQLSKQYHPDKNASPEAHDKFIEIGEAYDILSDPQKKQNFDQFGDANAQQQNGFGGFGDMFNQFFQGHQGGGQRRGQDTQVNIGIGLKDFFRGKDVEFDVEMNNICSTCTGLGSADGKTTRCGKCGGSGFVTVRRQMGPMVQQFQSHCDQCRGKGTTIAKLCGTCAGHGTTRQPRHYSIYVAAGTPKGHVHVLEREGDQSPEWVPGNMNLRFVEDSSDNWGYRRVNDNLYRTEVLSAREAREGGWKREIRLFDDETVALLRKAGDVVLDGQVDAIKGHGMPLLNDDSEYGVLYVQYRVVPVGGRAVKDEL